MGNQQQQWETNGHELWGEPKSEVRQRRPRATNVPQGSGGCLQEWRWSDYAINLT